MPSSTPGSFLPGGTPAPGSGFPRGIRRRSDYEYLGMPLWSVALGPDFARGEMRGHAKGVIAIGDMATGVIALGGLARGLFAFGGLAAGVVAFGGLAIGGLTLGGLAIGIIAFGGGALGWVAVGGAAAGYYAAGGAAFGTYVVSAMERSPEAIAFFAQWDWLWQWLSPNLPRR
jgi:hypothetical protein